MQTLALALITSPIAYALAILLAAVLFLNHTIPDGIERNQ